MTLADMLPMTGIALVGVTAIVSAEDGLPAHAYMETLYSTWLLVMRMLSKG